MAQQQPQLRLHRFAWGVVWYTVLIIAWGAWVRISHSGDGCGDHWPLCNGQAIPLDGPIKTWIEVSHRYSTALYGVLVLAMVWFSRRAFSSDPSARFWPVMVLFFTITEALIGRQLVTMRLVDQSTDLARLVVMPLHLVNTSALLLSAVMAAESFRWTGCARRPLPPQLVRLLGITGAVLLALLCTGALASLGSHLAPSPSLGAGLAKDLAPESHLAVRLRLIHPVLALATVVGVLFFFSRLEAWAPDANARAWYVRLRLATYGAVAIGILTLTLLAPAWLKLTHLLAANLLIILASVALFHTIRQTSNSAGAGQD
jgi:cytochrome c oxidase assembly protein subunit 15